MSRVTDPLGRQIELTDAAWHGHIVKGHPEMRRLRELVDSAITTPLAIHRSSSDPDCRIYYARGPREGLMICVVADVVAGIVKTGYLGKRIKPGAQEWPPQNPSKAPPDPSGSTTT